MLLEVHPMFRVKLSVFAALAACLLLVGTTRARQVDPKKIEVDLKTLGIAFQNYLDTFNKPPSKGDDFGPYIEFDKRILGLLKDNNIVFSYDVHRKDMADGGKTTVLAYEKDAPTKGG